MNKREERRRKKLSKKAARKAKPAKRQNAPSDQRPLSLAQSQALQRALDHDTAGQTTQAADIYRQILAEIPNQSDALLLLGMQANQAGDFRTAFDLISKSISVEPNYAEAHSQLGSALVGLGQRDDAVVSFRKALAYMPEYVETHNHLGNALKDLGRFEEAVISYQNALAIKPDYDIVLINLGIAQKNLGRYEDAVSSYQKALASNPDQELAYVNLGNVLKELGDWHGALSNYQQARTLGPDNPENLKNMGICQLLTGDYRPGWTNYAKRFESDDFKSRRSVFRIPYWNGGGCDGIPHANPDRAGKEKILVWMEQGVGDEIMFASMLPDLARRVGSVVVECDKRLIPLFQHAFPNLNFIIRSDPPAEELTDGGIHFQVSAGDLGRFLRTDVTLFPQQNFYLQADPDKRNRRRETYSQEAPGKRLVGIAWRSGNPENGLNRSLSLSRWAPILSATHCHFINLQYGDVGDELKALKENSGIDVFHDPCINPLDNMDDFAAQVAALDLVISIDNSTVHMAGALGVPTWVMLPYAPDWRWLLDRDDSPWYGSVRLFRQDKQKNWDGVIGNVSSALAQL